MPAADVDADVVVAGAGIAGLVAARALAARGVSVLVVEARERVGGRTYTVSFGSTPVDLGAHWVGPTQTRLLALARDLGVTTARQFNAGRKVLWVGGKRRTYRGAIPAVSPWVLLDMQIALMRLERLRRTVDLADPLRTNDATRWDAMTVEEWKRRILRTRAARAIFDAAIGTMLGAEAAELSLLYLMTILQAGGGLRALSEVDGAAQQDYFVGGAQQIAERIAHALEPRIVLGAPVRTIGQDERGVIVRSDRGAFRGRYAIVAMPPALAGRLVYEPPLTPARDALTQRMPMGAIRKSYVRYATPFWRDAGLSGEAVSDDGVASIVFDSSPADLSAGVLVAFMAGNAARTWSARSAAERRAAVLQALGRYFGPAAERPLEYLDFDWSDEPWSRGGPVGLMPPATWTTCGHALREPAGRIHWAGTETATRWTGYMDGAVESGERAAAEIVERLATRASSGGPQAKPCAAGGEVR